MSLVPCFVGVHQIFVNFEGKKKIGVKKKNTFIYKEKKI